MLRQPMNFVQATSWHACEQLRLEIILSSPKPRCILRVVSQTTMEETKVELNYISSSASDSSPQSSELALQSPAPLTPRTFSSACGNYLLRNPSENLPSSSPIFTIMDVKFTSWKSNVTDLSSNEEVALKSPNSRASLFLDSLNLYRAMMCLFQSSIATGTIHFMSFLQISWRSAKTPKTSRKWWKKGSPALSSGYSI